eukprot:scaffold4274_cov376-Prasinococcus_capsulatus_cf.AAC.5
MNPTQGEALLKPCMEDAEGAVVSAARKYVGDCSRPRLCPLGLLARNTCSWSKMAPLRSRPRRRTADMEHC